MLRRRVDPGPFSFMQGGWFALHALTIAGSIYVGKTLEKRKDDPLRHR
ncbi:hypothetical protein AAC978_09745 [Desulfitobacterium sp. THU1]